jgi:hypothetical protein
MRVEVISKDVGEGENGAKAYVTHPQTPWKTQMRISKWRQWKNELGYVPLFTTFQGVRRACWSSKMGIKMSDKWVNYSYLFAQTKKWIG